MSAVAWPRDARVVIVDDERPNLLLLERLLRREGYEDVQLFDDPLDALDAVSSQEPDLVLLDLHMPALDGVEFLRALRRVLPPAVHVPTLVLTADTSATSREQALEAGAKDFLTKPFDLTEVRLRIRNLLETRELHRRLAAHNHMLERQVAERTQDVEATRLELLERLAVVAELRDDDTYAHTVRVGRNAGVLAGALGLPPERRALIERAAPLHDIGKVGISDAILRKPGPLSEREFDEIRTHPVVGARVLAGSDTPVLQVAERIARQHHERWDGRGYPDGVRGRDIAIEARIVAVVDVFDALTHARPYKSAWPVARALEHIERLRGAHFDPDVAEAFLRCARDGCFHEEEP